jgi:hypothetical protein
MTEEEGTVITEQNPTNPGGERSQKKRRNRRKKKNQKGNTTDGNTSTTPNTPGKMNPNSGSPADTVRGSSSGFSEGDAYLSSLGLSISGRIETVNYVPKTDGYFKTVTAAYGELCALKPEATQALSLAEWLHCHALMVYARIANCEFDASGYKQPAPTRIPLPYDLKVFQPIFALLSNLGVVEDPELFVRYVPHGDMPRHDIMSAEEIGKTIDCTMYPWMTSWEDALQARESRKGEFSEKVTLDVETQPYKTIEEVKDARDEMVSIISDLQQILLIFKQFDGKKFDELPSETQKGVEELDIGLELFTRSGDEYTYHEYSITASNVNEAIAEAYVAAKAIKLAKFRPDLKQVRQDVID